MAAVTAKAREADAGDGGDGPAHPVDSADEVVVGVRDEQIPVGVDGDPGRGVHLGAGGRAAVAAEAGNTGAGDGGDDPGARLDPPDAMSVGVRDEQIPTGVDGDTDGQG